MSNYVRKKSQRQEKRTAKEFGGRTQAGSGAIWSGKGDVRTSSFLIENKFTDADFYKLDYAIWDKIEKEAIKDGLRRPLLQIDIADKSYVAMDVWDAREIFGENQVTIHAITTKHKSIKLNNEDLDFLVSPSDCMCNIFFSSLGKTLAVLSLDRFKFLLDQNNQ